MEGINWYNRTGYTDYRNHADGDERPLNQNVFRGSYRFDNDSPHHNETTYDGFDRSNRRPDNHTNHRAERPNQNRDYERDWSGTYHNSRGAFDREDYDRNQFSENRNQNREQNNQQQNRGRQNRYNDGLQDRHLSNNMNTNPNYGPDNYNYNRGENYGNMAGSLSFGYDGTSTYNQDWNNRYDPMSGEIKSKHGNYTSRRPNFYDDDDRERNPDDFRPLGRR